MSHFFFLFFFLLNPLPRQHLPVSPDSGHPAEEGTTRPGMESQSSSSLSSSCNVRELNMVQQDPGTVVMRISIVIPIHTQYCVYQLAMYPSNPCACECGLSGGTWIHRYIVHTYMQIQLPWRLQVKPCFPPVPRCWAHGVSRKHVTALPQPSRSPLWGRARLRGVHCLPSLSLQSPIWQSRQENPIACLAMHRISSCSRHRCGSLSAKLKSLSLHIIPAICPANHRPPPVSE